MYNVLYKARFKIVKDRIAEAEPVVQELFKMFTEGVYTDYMTLSFDPVTGWFTFDTMGNCEIPQWMADDIPLFLKQLGGMARRGTVVRHRKGGEVFDFPVGPNKLAKQQAVQMDALQHAIDALADVRPHVPDELTPELDKLAEELETLFG